MEIGIKTRSIFYKPPYWKHLKIFHLLDPSYILKKKLIFFKDSHIIEKNNTLSFKRDVSSVVPTTTPPLVLPSNGKYKGAPTKIFNPTPMEGWI